MDFCIRDTEAAGAGVIRVVAEQLAAAVRHLDVRGTLEAEAIHEARKSMKRVRSVMRLSRKCWPVEFKQVNAAVRGVARELSPWRDADALVEAFDQLIEESGVRDGEPEDAPPLFAGLRQRLVDEARGGQGVAALEGRSALVKRAVATLRGVHALVSGLDASTCDGARLAKGVRTVRRRGRRAMDEALEVKTGECFHEWRKEAKHYWYACQILSGVCPAIKETGLQRGLKELAEVLGIDHDLVILKDWALDPRHARAGLSPFAMEEERLAFVMLVDATQERLRERAEKLGAKVYRKKTRGLAKTLDALPTKKPDAAQDASPGDDAAFDGRVATETH